MLVALVRYSQRFDMRCQLGRIHGQASQSVVCIDMSLDSPKYIYS